MALVDNVQKHSKRHLLEDDDLSLPHHGPALNDPLIAPPSLFQKRPVIPAVKSFEETYKTSYSHGLESIYALENVDIKSVKKLEFPSKVKQVRKKNKQSAAQKQQAQLEFDFSSQFNQSVESFLPREPIQVLGLFRHAEKCLLENGKTILSDLIDVDLQEFIFFKGMGQGYIDEIRSKLEAYLEGRSIWRTETIDFASWVRSLVGKLDRKKTAVVLRQFQLGDLIELTAAENMEVNRITPDQIKDYTKELIAHLGDAQHTQFTRDFKQLLDVFIRPWIRGRNGLATYDEVLERMEKISVEPLYMEPALQFFNSVFHATTSLLQSYLLTIGDNLLSADRHIRKHYQWVNQSASSYFYKAGICYTFTQLVSLIEREMAKEWVNVANGFVEKALRYSPDFSIRKDATGKLVVRSV